jgi:hypothetical protein
MTARNNLRQVGDTKLSLINFPYNTVRIIFARIVLGIHQIDKIVALAELCVCVMHRFQYDNPGVDEVRK